MGPPPPEPLPRVQEAIVSRRRVSRSRISNFSLAPVCPLFGGRAAGTYWILLLLLRCTTAAARLQTALKKFGADEGHNWAHKNMTPATAEYISNTAIVEGLEKKKKKARAPNEQAMYKKARDDMHRFDQGRSAERNVMIAKKHKELFDKFYAEVLEEAKPSPPSPEDTDSEDAEMSAIPDGVCIPRNVMLGVNPDESVSASNAKNPDESATTSTGNDWAGKKSTSNAINKGATTAKPKKRAPARADASSTKKKRVEGADGAPARQTVVGQELLFSGAPGVAPGVDDDDDHPFSCRAAAASASACAAAAASAMPRAPHSMTPLVSSSG